VADASTANTKPARFLKGVPVFLPAAPPGGGYLVLNAAQISSLDLLCLIRTVYPHTRIIAQQMIPLTPDTKRAAAQVGTVAAARDWGEVPI